MCVCVPREILKYFTCFNIKYLSRAYKQLNKGIFQAIRWSLIARKCNRNLWSIPLVYTNPMPRWNSRNIYRLARSGSSTFRFNYGNLESAIASVQSNHKSNRSDSIEEGSGCAIYRKTFFRLCSINLLNLKLKFFDIQCNYRLT